MRIECPSCLELSEAQLIRAAEQFAVFTCGGCEADLKVLVKAENPLECEEESNASVEGDCPKCNGAVSEGSMNCPGCGLGRDRFSDFDQAGPTATPALASAWKRVEAAWNKNSAHEDFAAEVALASDYRLGALWYRQAATVEGRAEKAIEMLDRMQTMATAALISVKPVVKEEEQPYKNVVILLMVLLFLGAGVGIILKGGGDSDSSQDETPSKRNFEQPGRR
ncbi:MAG: hypothetical protein GY811_11805 [Myxococcales bacterium]|nr:hypothetical protein [Myxococcales bacterium]